MDASMFSGAQNFRITGGHFTSINRASKTSVSNYPDFPCIPLGHIDLLHEICLEVQTGVVRRKQAHEVHPLRRFYSARIDGRASSVTVATYQGLKSKEWERDIMKHKAVRHPNLVQVTCVSTSEYLHALVFMDDLIPFQQFLNTYKQSPILTVYIYGYSNTEFEGAREYIYSHFRQWLFHTDCTLWIRQSTGRLCVDFVPGSMSLNWRTQSEEISRQPRIGGSQGQDFEAISMHLLSLEHYHEITYYELQKLQYTMISSTIPISLGAVIDCSEGNSFENLIEIASIPDPGYELYVSGWTTGRLRESAGDLMENGCTRMSLDDCLHEAVQLWRVFQPNLWLSQANYIFNSLGLTTEFHNYSDFHSFHPELKLNMQKAEWDSPQGFLFLCPVSDFRQAQLAFKWPQCPAYWSLDPSGTTRLSAEQAAILGFPSLSLCARVRGVSWDTSVYTGLARFHSAKGFNPESQEVAQYLDEPLYQCGIGLENTDPENNIALSISSPSSGLAAMECLEHIEALPVSLTFTLIFSMKLMLILFTTLLNM